MNKLILAATVGLLAASPAVAQQKTATLPDGKVVYISKAPGDTASIGTFYNRNVYNRSGEKLGDVNDLLLSPDGRISTAVIGVGGFLGVGEKEVAVAFDSLKVVRKDATWQLVMDASKDSLTAAPAFQSTGDRGVTTPSSPSVSQPVVVPQTPKQ